MATFDIHGDSDHYPCMDSLTEPARRRKTPFKFFSFFSKHSDFQNLVKDAWEDVILFGPPMITLCKRLWTAKICCKNLNISSFGNIQLRTRKAFEILTQVERRL